MRHYRQQNSLCNIMREEDKTNKCMQEEGKNQDRSVEEICCEETFNVMEIACSIICVNEDEQTFNDIQIEAQS